MNIIKVICNHDLKWNDSESSTVSTMINLTNFTSKVTTCTNQSIDADNKMQCKSTFWIGWGGGGGLYKCKQYLNAICIYQFHAKTSLNKVTLEKCLRNFRYYVWSRSLQQFPPIWKRKKRTFCDERRAAYGKKQADREEMCEVLIKKITKMFRVMITWYWISLMNSNT